jgi:hypothetical protein
MTLVHSCPSQVLPNPLHLRTAGVTRACVASYRKDTSTLEYALVQA